MEVLDLKKMVEAKLLKEGIKKPKLKGSKHVGWADIESMYKDDKYNKEYIVYVNRDIVYNIQSKFDYQKKELEFLYHLLEIMTNDSKE